MNPKYTEHQQFAVVDAAPQHSVEIIQLVNDSYWLEQKPFFIDTPLSRERINQHEWSKILSDPYQKAYVLQHRVTKLTAGVVVLKIPLNAEYGKFGVFAVAKAYQGKNLGQILIDHVEETAKKLSKKSIKIEVFAFAERLKKYYEKTGYVTTGKTKSFFHSACIKQEYRNITSQYLVELEKIIN